MPQNPTFTLLFRKGRPKMRENNPKMILRGPRLTRRRLMRGAVLTGAGLAAAAMIGCGGDDDEEASAKPGEGAPSELKRGTFVTSSATSGQTLSPNSTAANSPEYYALYDTLTRLPDEGLTALQPALATSWEL